MTQVSDIFAARAIVFANVKGHLDAAVAEINAAQLPSEDFPGGLFPDGLTATLEQARRINELHSRQLAAAMPTEPEPEPEGEPE